MVAWKLPKGAALVGSTTGKGTQKVVLHLHKLAPKAVRLDAAPVRSRTSVRGVRVVELKAGDSVVWLAAPAPVWPAVEKARGGKARRS